MSPVLEQLHRLQDLERQAAQMQAQLDAVPARRLEIEAPVTEAQRTLEALASTIEDRQASRRAGDRDVTSLQARLTKYRQQLMTVTNSREYEAVQHEIATVEGELKTREDTVIGWLFEIDELVPQAEAARAEVAARRETADHTLAALEREAQHTRLALAAVEGHIAATRAGLPVDGLALYDRTSKRFPRSAVAEMRGDLCAGCNVKLRPMVVTEARRGEKLVQCDNCTRILYAVRPPAAPAPAATSA